MLLGKLLLFLELISEPVRMKRIIAIFLMLNAVLLHAQTMHIPLSNVIKERNGKQYYIHTVEKGQTVYSIAKAYDVTVKEVYFENPDAEKGIRVGQELWIPTVNKETEIRHETKQSSFDFFYHIAARDETFKHIGSIYLIPERYIRLANPGLKEPLREGEYVKVPVESAFPILDGNPVKQVQKSNPVENEARNFTIEQPGAKKIPKYKPPVVDEKPVVTTVDKHKTLPVQSDINNNTGQVAFDPTIPVITDYRHVVIMGETLESIAKKYGITVRDLKSVNPGLIMAAQGQRLRLPVTAKIPGYKNYTKPQVSSGTVKKNTEVKKSEPAKQVQNPQPQGEKKYYYHKVKKKETLYSISRLYGVTLEDLYNNNENLTPNIKAGQIIKVPKKKISKNYILYTPPQNIRLKKLSKKFLVSYNTLKKFNPLLGKKVYAGQQVKIPVGKMALIAPQSAGKPVVEPEKEQPPEKPVAKQKCMPRYGGFHRKFKIALMIPLYLEEADSVDIERFMAKQQNTFKPFRFVKFLEGALLAVDSLRKAGMAVDLYVYDVDNKLTKTAEVLSKKELRQMDLIIGPFYKNPFKQVALFAGQFNIPVVNPFTTREELAGNYDNVLKIKPAVSVQPGLTANVIKRYYRNYKVFLVTQTSYKDADEVIKIQNAVSEVLPPSVKFSNADLINLGYNIAARDEFFTPDAPLPQYRLEGKNVNPEMLKPFPDDSSTFVNNMVRINYLTDSIHPVENQASVLRKNLVIIYGSNKGYIMDAMNRLNRLTDTFDIKVIGLPLWEKLKNPDYVQMNNLNVLYTSSKYIDYNSEKIGDFEKVFKEKYFTVPEYYGFSGFDITWLFGKILYGYGTDFTECLPQFEHEGLITTYRFIHTPENVKSFENGYWNILKITGKTEMKLPDISVNTANR